MIQITGTYNKGNIILDRAIVIDKIAKVVVTFVDKDVNLEQDRLKISDFSFLKSRNLLENVKGSLSDAVVEDRRNNL